MCERVWCLCVGTRECGVHALWVGCACGMWCSVRVNITQTDMHSVCDWARVLLVHLLCPFGVTIAVHVHLYITESRNDL